jgi:hypothetical protein
MFQKHECRTKLLHEDTSFENVAKFSKSEQYNQSKLVTQGN